MAQKIIAKLATFMVSNHPMKFLIRTPPPRDRWSFCSDVI